MSKDYTNRTKPINTYLIKQTSSLNLTDFASGDAPPLATFVCLLYSKICQYSVRNRTTCQRQLRPWTDYLRLGGFIVFLESRLIKLTGKQ